MNAYIDENGVRTMIATLDSDGSTIKRVTANPTNNGLSVSDGTTGSDNGNNNNCANKDENSTPVLMAVSSADGTTPIEIYCDSDGKLLIQTT